MHDLRCPSCRMRLYQGMGSDVPLPHDCPACRVSRPIDRADAGAARPVAPIERDHRARRLARERDDVVAGPPVRPGRRDDRR